MKWTLLLSLIFFALHASADTNGRIITDEGTIGIKLYASTSNTTANFIALATGRKKYVTVDGGRGTKPFYDGMIFHRVHPDLGIFSGCPWGTGRGWPGFFIPDEIDKDAKFSRPGLIAMAKIAGDNKAGSQFFITTKPDPRLNGKYTIFGEVTSGMDVVEKISHADHDVTLKPKKPIHIKQIEIIEQ